MYLVACKGCGKEVVSYPSTKRKFCSHECAWRSYLKSPSEILGLSPAEKQKRYRTLHANKFKDSCACGALKGIKAEFCRACKDKNWSGEKSPYFKGGYENHLKLNRERAQKLKIIGNHTPQEWESLKEKYKNMCLCCKLSEPFISLTRDHIIPLSKGGSDNIDNIQPLCRGCNSRKYTTIINYLEPLKHAGAGL